MKFNVSFKLTDPETKESKKVIGTAEIYDSGAFSYGNGKGLYLKIEIDGRESTYDYDIRYDKRYSSKDPAGFIKTVIADNWSGNNGSGRATYIRVRKIFRLEEADVEKIRNAYN